MAKSGLTRRGFIASVAAVGAARLVPVVATKLGGKRVLELVMDRATGTLRAVDGLID
jgi:hypothetical protein